MIYGRLPACFTNFNYLTVTFLTNIYLTRKDCIKNSQLFEAYSNTLRAVISRIVFAIT